MKKTEILKKLKPGEVHTIEHVQERSECDTFISLVARWDRQNAKAEGRYIHVSIIPYPNEYTIHLVCTSYEEYWKEKMHEIPQKSWKRYIGGEKNPYIRALIKRLIAKPQTFFTVKELADIQCVDVSTIRQQIHRGKIPAVRVGRMNIINKQEYINKLMED